MSLVHISDRSKHSGEMSAGSPPDDGHVPLLPTVSGPGRSGHWPALCGKAGGIYDETLIYHLHIGAGRARRALGDGRALPGNAYVVSAGAFEEQKGEDTSC